LFRRSKNISQSSETLLISIFCYDFCYLTKVFTVNFYYALANNYISVKKALFNLFYINANIIPHCDVP